MLKFKVIKESYEDLKYLENFIQLYKISNQIIGEKRKKFSILIPIDNFSIKIII